MLPTGPLGGVGFGWWIWRLGEQGHRRWLEQTEDQEKIILTRRMASAIMANFDANITLANRSAGANCLAVVLAVKILDN